MPRFRVTLIFGDQIVTIHVTANDARAAAECATLVAVETDPKLPALTGAEVDMETVFLGGPDAAA